MSAVVTAAIVGVSGTVIVGVAGFGASIWNTRKTIAHARESRIWDQQRTVYVEVLAAMNYRALKRELETQIAPMPDEDRQRKHARLATYKEPDWHELEARLQAFASEPVIRAVQASVARDEYVFERFDVWQKLGGGTSGNMNEVLLDSLWQTQGNAREADRRARELIRAELQDRHPRLRDWQSLLGLPDPRPGTIPLMTSRR